MNRHIVKRGFLSLVPLMGLFFLICSPADSATYYVRLDGGTATQCTGLADAPYPGSGTNQACAFSHPFWAHAPRGNNPTKMVGGDTLIIDGSNNAEYMMGFKAPNTADTSKCGQSWPYDCYMNPIPSGPDPAHPTRILGKGWNTGCAAPPQLWATERAEVVINLQGSDNVEIQCLEITDHSSCQEHGPNPCNRTSYPFGPWGKIGLRAWDSENILLKNINIHGMAFKGIQAGRLRDWTIEDSKIVANSFVGWEGDVGAFNSSNSGTMMFVKTEIKFNGCGETYPGKQPYNCYSQGQGGYGDGLGTHQTGGHWVFDNCDISHNVSDGMDLLYHDGNGTVTIKRSRFEGNAGNQVKISAPAEISNSIIIGNCNYFANGAKTWDVSGFVSCRAGGNSLVFSFHPGMKTFFYNSTLTGSGDTIVMSSQRSGCNGTEQIIARNNIFLAGPQYGHPDTTDLYYAAGAGGNGDGLCGKIVLDDDYSVIWGTKNIKTACNGKAHSLCENPKFNEPAVQWYYGDAYDISLQSTSPAIGKGLVLTGKSGLDYSGNERGDIWDIGAVEYGIASTQPTCKDGIQYCLTQTDCTSNGHYWYNNTCNAQPKPLTCVDGIQYCLTQTDCVNNGHYWYNNTCNAQPKPLTCVDGIQYCLTQTDCVNNGYYWYNNICNAQPQPKTCADGIQYCTTQTSCEGRGYYWYNNTCNAQPKPLTCADGIQYCLTQTDCVNNGYYWYNNICNTQPQPKTCADGIQYCTTQTACEGQNYFWYNNTCNVQPQPKTCADGIQYCTTQTACEGQNYFWYNNTCNVQPKPLTCVDGIQYCLTQTDCVNNGYYWYNNTCNAQPQPAPTCADGAQYCKNKPQCTTQGYYWYNNTCNAQPQLTCADGIQYCSTKSECEGQGYYWYANSCNPEPKEPTPPSQQKQDSSSLNSTSLASESDSSVAPTTELTSNSGPTADISTETSDDKIVSADSSGSQPEPLTNSSSGESKNKDIEKPEDINVKSTDSGSSQSASVTSSSNRESKNEGAEKPEDIKVKSADSGSSQPVSVTSSSGGSKNRGTGGGGGGGSGGGRSGGGRGGGSSGGIGVGSSAGNKDGSGRSGSVEKIKGDSASNLTKGTPPITAPQPAKGTPPIVTSQSTVVNEGGTSSILTKKTSQIATSQSTAANKDASTLITPSLPLTDNASISLNRNDIAAEAEVTLEPTAESIEDVNLTDMESETSLDKTIAWVNDLWRNILRWFSGN